MIEMFGFHVSTLDQISAPVVFLLVLMHHREHCWGLVAVVVVGRQAPSRSNRG